MNYQTNTNEKIYNENVEILSSYIISLYYKTGCKYYCYRTKINRLLTIYKLCAMKYNTNCLNNEYIIKDPSKHVGMIFPFVVNFFPRDIYFNVFPVQEDGKEICDKFDETSELPNILGLNVSENIEKIGDESQELLENIFRKFGNYCINDLANMIDGIIKNIPIIKIDDECIIDNNNYQNFLDSNFNNEVFEFIKKFKKDNITSNNKIKNLKNSKIY